MLTPPLLWLAVLCLMWPRALGAQDLPFGISLPPSLNFATSASPVGSGARAQGKALAFIGVADDTTATSHNPGGLVQIECPEVSILGSYFLRSEQQDVSRPNPGPVACVTQHTYCPSAPPQSVRNSKKVSDPHQVNHAVLRPLLPSTWWSRSFVPRRRWYSAAD